MREDLARLTENEREEFYKRNRLSAEAHKQRLHEEVQLWGEAVVPLLKDDSDPYQKDKEAFFKYLMESVERGDNHTAAFIRQLKINALGITINYYNGSEMENSTDEQERVIRKDFTTLFNIYQLGAQAGRDSA